MKITNAAPSVLLVSMTLRQESSFLLPYLSEIQAKCYGADKDVLLLIPLSTPVQAIRVMDELKAFCAPHLSAFNSDCKAQVIGLVSAVKDTQTSLPDNAYLQVRRIEVPLYRYEEYLAWREKTIFEFVKKTPEIATFLAYHSVLSTTPGVVFLSGFDGNPDQYLSCFAQPEYRDIVKVAGERYISGGANALSTILYKRIA